MTKPFNLQRSIIWQDSSLLVVNKPSGLLTIPDGYDSTIPDLRNLLESKYSPLFVVHRLDRDTSGVILLARTMEAHQALNGQFQNREITKIYHALVLGKPTWTEAVIDNLLLPDGDRRHRTIIHPSKGKPASTTVRVLQSFRGFSLIEASPHTGYIHQIRAHLAGIGYPILADPLYGDGKPLLLSNLKPKYRRSEVDELPLISRTALHAFSIQFIHPHSEVRVEFTAPYPKDLSAAINQIEKYH